MSSVSDKPGQSLGSVEQPSVTWQPREAVPEADLSSEVVEILAARDEDVAKWYLGALETLAVPRHSDAFAQAAHGLREVMNRLHVLAGAPVPPVGSLGSRFQKLVLAWRRGQDQSRCYEGGRWSGDIDDGARAAFQVVAETIEWHETFMPSRREAFLLATRQLDPSGRTLPEPEEQRLWRAWSSTKEYFDAVAHHGKQTTEGEFRSEVERLNGFVIRLFRRDVHAEQLRIAALVARAEHGA